MEKDKNKIEQILALKERKEFNTRQEIISKISDLEYYSQKENLNEEFLKYFPIAIVACFESFFRSTIKEMIDFGSPFIENVKEFKNQSFNFDIVHAFHTKSISIGELVSHNLPCSNLEDINFNISKITKGNFLKDLEKFEHKTFKSTSVSFVNNFNEIIQSIKRTFEMRHIFCHESAIHYKINREEIFTCLENSIIFLDHCNDYFWHLIYPNLPTSDSEMKKNATEALDKAKSELDELISKIIESKKESLGFNVDLFKKSILDWENYKISKANSESYVLFGGMYYPILHYGSQTNTIHEKIESLKKAYFKD